MEQNNLRFILKQLDDLDKHLRWEDLRNAKKRAQTIRKMVRMEMTKK